MPEQYMEEPHESRLTEGLSRRIFKALGIDPDAPILERQVVSLEEYAAAQDIDLSKQGEES